MPTPIFAAALLAVLMSCAGTSQSPDPNSDPAFARAEARAIYEAAKSRYPEYEDLHGSFVETSNGRMHVLRWGDSGLPLVWLHGTYSSAYEIATAAEGLEREGFQVIAVDYYGHGRTPLPAEDYSLAEVTHDVAEVMDALDLESAVLGGWSRGGALAAAFFDAHPERTRGLILADGGSWSLTKFTADLDDDGLRAWLAPWADAETGELSSPTFESEYDLFHYHWTRVRLDATWTDLFALLAQASQTEDGRWTYFRPSLCRRLGQDSFAATFKSMREPATTTPFLRDSSLVDPTVVFRDLDVPVLVLDPTGDLLDVTDQNHALAEAHPEWVEHVVYAETGHNLLQQRPARFLNDAKRLLARVEVRP